MKNKKNQHIIPMAIELSATIKEKVYFLKLPKNLKERLVTLEEKSKKEKFNRDKYFLPLNSLKKLITLHIYGVSDMKPVNSESDDDRWLISTDPIDVKMVVKVLKIWIKAFYIEETELKKKRNNNNDTISYAENLVEEISEEWFEGCAYHKEITLFEDSKVKDNDAFSIFPMVITKKFTGNKVVKPIAGETPTWYYSGKNEILTEPLALTGKNKDDYFSFVVSFSVQTLPPSNKPYLNIKISMRRWIGRKRYQKLPYYKDTKNVYVKFGNNTRLQVFSAKYSNGEFDWKYTDKMILNQIYDAKEKFSEILLKPGEYINRSNSVSYYIPFEYGMKTEGSSMHKQNAGISYMDRYEVFNSVKSVVNEYGEVKKAIKVFGIPSVIRHIFGKRELNHEQYKDDDAAEGFIHTNIGKLVKDIYGNEHITFEIYGNPSDEVENPIVTKLKEQIDTADLKADIKVFDDSKYEKIIGILNTDDGQWKDDANVNERIRYIENILGKTTNPTVAIITIQEPEAYKIGGRADKKADPKTAIRIGFANTGRLTQFITKENYKGNNKGNNTNETDKEDRKDSIINSTILDCYRQLGINSLLNVKYEGNIKNPSNQLGKFLKSKIVVGIHVVNQKKMHNKNTSAPLPLIVNCNYNSNEVTVETEFNIINSGNKREAKEHIKCKYNEFPIKFRKIMKKFHNCRIEPSDNFLYNWFNELDDAKEYIIIITADGTTRKLIEGITNKSISNEKTENENSIKKLKLKDQTIDLSKFKNISIVRLRVNDEVPDYILEGEGVTTSGKPVFDQPNGIFKYEDVYYSKDMKALAEKKYDLKELTKLGNNKAFTHRNIIEMYPIYDSFINNKKDECPYCIQAVHGMRGASIHTTSNYTVLPLQLYLAKQLEEYFI